MAVSIPLWDSFFILWIQTLIKWWTVNVAHRWGWISDTVIVSRCIKAPPRQCYRCHRCCLFCLIRPEVCASLTSPSLSRQFCCTLSGQRAPLLFLLICGLWWHHTKTTLVNSKTHLCLWFSEEQSLVAMLKTLTRVCRLYFDTRDNLTMTVIFSPNDHDLFLTLTRTFSRLNFA